MNLPLTLHYLPQIDWVINDVIKPLALEFAATVDCYYCRMLMKYHLRYFAYFPRITNNHFRMISSNCNFVITFALDELLL